MNPALRRVGMCRGMTSTNRHSNRLKDKTFCPYKGLASYYDVGSHKRAAWSYVNAWSEVGRVRNLVSFEPDKIDVYLDGKQLQLEPGQTVIPHGFDRGLDTDEVLGRTLSLPGAHDESAV